MSTPQTVKLPAFWHYGAGDVPATSVTIDERGVVTWQGDVIGVVEKGHRTYSPPTHKGSRIVKYHKQVPEWHGWYKPMSIGRAPIRRDYRRQVLHDLIAHHVQQGSLFAPVRKFRWARRWRSYQPSRSTC